MKLECLINILKEKEYISIENGINIPNIVVETKIKSVRNKIMEVGKKDDEYCITMETNHILKPIHMIQKKELLKWLGENCKKESNIIDDLTYEEIDLINQTGEYKAYNYGGQASTVYNKRIKEERLKKEEKMRIEADAFIQALP